jgi:hypothetical protein
VWNRPLFFGPVFPHPTFIIGKIGKNLTWKKPFFGQGNIG